jgi:transcriptional regulator with XRE-family HTH domain
VVDGGKPEELEDSRKFIEKLSELVQKLFGLPESTCCIIERGNKIELKIANKWFCRYIRHCFNLPKSYKKGELSRPEIFDSGDLSNAYWRGVFDTDGHMAKRSYRTSMATATEDFADECINDLEDKGISTRKRSDLGAHHVRIPGTHFENFSRQIGFSHPRKRREMLSKLKQGSRNYKYEGRNERAIQGPRFDLTRMPDLRVRGLGEEIKRYREEGNLYQEELANNLDCSKNQIYYWENNEYAAPVDFLFQLYNSKSQFLELLEESELKYKVGIRGTEESLIKIPVKASEEVDKIASNVVVSEDELRVKDKSEEIASAISDLFGTEVKRKEYKFVSSRHTIVRFFSTFYRYEKNFGSRTSKEVEKLRDNLEIV